MASLDDVSILDVLSGFYFSVDIGSGGSTSDAAFQEASGLSVHMTPEEVVCGGENRFKFRLPTTSTFENLVLKRGVTTAKSPLLSWCKATLSGGNSMPIVTKNVIVNLLDPQGKSTKSWVFNHAYPVKWSAAELNAEKNAVFIETIELAFQYFEVSDL